MKYIIWGLLLVSIVYVGWPYAYAYRIDKALTESDRAVLNRLVDLDAIRSEIKRNIERDMDTALGLIPMASSAGSRARSAQIGERAIDESIDLGLGEPDVDHQRSRSASKPPTPFSNPGTSSW